MLHTMRAMRPSQLDASTCRVVAIHGLYLASDRGMLLERIMSSKPSEAVDEDDGSDDRVCRTDKWLCLFLSLRLKFFDCASGDLPELFGVRGIVFNELYFAVF
mmetsp:Transcript_16360/g.31985  ORF Transcript_16360/g.31985 Transcript_16360/m.31985 type:complete len:103 (-) Transcript_16360:780-1088(-)